MKAEPLYRDTGETFFTDGNSIYVNFINEQTEPHLHVHDFIEISYVASGTGIHILGDKEYKVSKGDLFLINYHIPHEFRSLDTTMAPPLQVYNCVFRPEFLDINLLHYKEFSDVIHYLSFRSIFSFDSEEMGDLKILGGENSELENIYIKMLTEYTLKKDGYIELLRVYLMELMIKIFRILKNTSNSQINTITHHAKLIEQSIQYLKTNYSVSTKLNDIASKTFLSPTYFCRLFKDYTGMTVSEYTQRLRIEEACNLLKETDYKVIAIAQLVGYKDIKYFNEIFKKLTGMTPSGYKKSVKRS